VLSRQTGAQLGEALLDLARSSGDPLACGRRLPAARAPQEQAGTASFGRHALAAVAVLSPIYLVIAIWLSR
jgi:hypothetical protein